MHKRIHKNLGIWSCFFLLGLSGLMLMGSAFGANPDPADNTPAPSKTTTKNKRLEDSPEVAEKLRLAVEKMGANKTGTLKINTANVEAARANAAKESVPNPTAINAAQAHANKPASSTRSAKTATELAAKKKPLPDTTHEATHEHAHWTYDGKTGPVFWSTLAPENQTCASGQRQSPVHIQDSDVFTLEGMENIGFEYRASAASIINNGHTLQVDMNGDNRLRVRGNEYRLVQFHFHHPAEERINFQGYEMVAHLVHRNAEGQLAVVAVLFEVGTPNALLQTVWGNMPLEMGDRVRWSGSAIDVAKLLPTDRRYYQFIGSLTTPPCTEGVLWIVLKQPMTMSAQQLATFSRLFPNNARPTQPTNGRIIKSAQ